MRIDRFEMLAVVATTHLVDVDVEVDCSSGTYIRALARDVGATLAVGGHLTALRRTRVGRFGLDQARSLDDLAERPGLSLTLDEACLLLFPHRQLSDDEADAVANGRALNPAGVDGVYAAHTADGRVMALLRDDGPQDQVGRRHPAGEPYNDTSGAESGNIPDENVT